MKRSLIVKTCGAIVYNREINEIIDEIERDDPLKVSEAIQLPKSKALKIIMRSQKMVTDASERGLFLFDLYIFQNILVKDTYA